MNGNMGVWKNWLIEIWVNGKMRMETWPNENGQMETWVNEPYWNGNTKTSKLSMGMEIRRNGDMGTEHQRMGTRHTHLIQNRLIEYGPKCPHIANCPHRSDIERLNKRFRFHQNLLRPIKRSEILVVIVLLEPCSAVRGRPQLHWVCRHGKEKQPETERPCNYHGNENHEEPELGNKAAPVIEHQFYGPLHIVAYLTAPPEGRQVFSGEILIFFFSIGIETGVGRRRLLVVARGAPVRLSPPRLRWWAPIRID